MTARVQDSPFRETAWDQRLDKMLDDLKTTVNPEDGRSSRPDNSLVSSFSHHLQGPEQTFLDIFRSSSRSESRNSARSGVEDGGLMKHHHKEYTSPDKTSKVVSDQFEYESGDPNKHYRKKVMKSTYSNYKVTGDITRDLDSLQEGPPQSIMDAARETSYKTENTKVVSASQKVANKLVDALSTIGPDGQPIPDGESSSSTDYSTLTRLRKNIKELDSMLEEMDRNEASSSMVIKTATKTVVKNEKTTTKGSVDEKVVEKREVVKGTTEKDESTTKKLKTSEDGSTDSHNYTSKSSKYTTAGMPNGKHSYDDEEMEIMNEPAGEVRKIVWRNRFEKTFEAQDGTPHISIEEEARRKREEKIQKALSSYTAPPPPQRGPVSPRNLQLQYAVYWPNFSPNMSPGGQSWADPIPMPTPPNISPKGEPGVAYVYTYGQNSSSQLQHLPPLNYVNMPPSTTVPLSDGAPSPTPSGTQPIIYHYSYHYTLQPGQSLPGGVPKPPEASYPTQPALQVAPTPSTDTYKGPSPMSSYEYKKTTTSHTSSAADRNTTNILHHRHSPERSLSETRYPRSPRDGPSYDDRYPKDIEPDSNRNISITINKHSSHMTHTKDYPSGGPSTSTPFPTPGRRSRSSSPDKYSRGPGTAPYGTVTHITRGSYSDSLERLRKPPHEGLPFPDTSPIRPKDDTKIPRRVDDLMTSLSDSEDGPHRVHVDTRGMNGPRPRAPSVEKEPLMTTTKISSENTDLALSERKAELKKEGSKNVAGPPVYYPPGHHQLFDESMHTMTLKENKRRGMAKWRMEKASGYKEKGSSSESKGGMAMVPVCLPLCCGAACAIM